MEVKVDTANDAQPAPVQGELAAGAGCGEWVVERSIGRGAFGDVYRARHRITDQLAAIKLLRRELGANPTAVSRFEREARISSSLSVDGVARVFDFARLADGRPFMAMELLEGEDLKQRLRREGRLSLAEVLRIIGSIVDVLEQLHARGIVHRDIKASNVFLATAAGTPTRVVVLDFGLGKLLEGTGQLTASRQMLGTPASMAPEQVLGQPVDSRSDIYALACLTFHALTGRLPFEHESVSVLCQMHLHARVPNLSSRLNGAEHHALDGVIGRAMSKRPELRYASVREFLGALLSASEGTNAQRCRVGSIAVVCVEVYSAAHSAATEPIFEELEGVLGFSSVHLQSAGAHLALRAGNLAAFYVEHGPDWRQALATRRALRATVKALRHALTSKLGSTPKVGVRLRVSSGRATLQGAELLESARLDQMVSGAAPPGRSPR